MKIEIPDNATNGEVIKTMFNLKQIIECEDCVIVFGENFSYRNTYPLDWWNSLYK